MGIALLFFWSFVGLLALGSFALTRGALYQTRARYRDRDPNSPVVVDALRQTARNTTAFGVVCFLAYVYFVGQWSGFLLGLGLLPLVAQQAALAGAWRTDLEATEPSYADTGFE